MINVNMTDKAGVTLATAGKYCADNVKVTPSAEILRKDEQAKTATPTTSAQDITPDAGKALSKVTVNPITAAIVGGLDADSFAASIVSAIEGKGVTVPSGAKLDALAALIESIEAGGGGSNFATGTFTTTDDITSNIVLTHNLAVKPKYFFLYPINYNNNYTLKILGMATQHDGKIEMIYINPGKSSANASSTSSDEASENATTGFWYIINYNETTFTIKQKNFSSTYGIGANTEFIWVAL